MAFGLAGPAEFPDIPDIMKFDSNAGRLFIVNYNHDTREKDVIDITSPPPKFAFDAGSLEVGYGHFGPNGPDFRMVPEGQPLPPQPLDKDEKGRLKFRPGFRAKAFGKVLGGLREWASTSATVLDVIEDVYNKFRQSPEALTGKIPIVELTKTIPVTYGRPPRQRTVYAPALVICGWTDRVPQMGERTVPPPGSKAPPTAAPPTYPPSGGSAANDLNDEIPF